MNFNVILNISEVVCNKCCRQNFERSITVTSTSQRVNLQNGYVLNVIAVHNTYVTVLIQNGVETIIRNVSTSFATELCLPCKDSRHLLTLTANVISTP